MVLGVRIADFAVHSGPDGVAEYSITGRDAGRNPVEFSGDGLISSLGGRAGPPPAIADMVNAALRGDPSSVSAELLFDNGGQYLGYRVAVPGHEIDVTGAASRFIGHLQGCVAEFKQARAGS